MMGSRRGRPGPARPVRRRLGSNLEALEGRTLLSAFGYQNFYHPSNLVPTGAPHRSPLLYLNHPLGAGQKTLAGLDNDGKILTGKDRDGDEWQITVHGPGAVIVTDATPNDGALDDDLDMIQIVGADPLRTVVEGQVTASARVITDGTVRFNRLFSESGVNQIVLNGFNLARTVNPPLGTLNNAGFEVYLPNGVQYLSFNNVEAPIDVALNEQPVDIVIGQPNAPLPFQPTIRIGSVFNTVFDSTVPAVPAGVPRVEPSVNILVNGQLRGLEMISATGVPIQQAGLQFNFPNVGATGRTAVRALGIDGLKVDGTARNLSLSRSAIPFRNSFAGLDRLGHATFGGVTDGVAIDVSQGNIGRLTFRQGIGDPTGALPGAQNLGRPVPAWGNAAFGLLGGTIVTNNIGKLEVGPSQFVFLTGQDPDYQQLDRTNWTTFYTRPGRAMINTVVMTENSIRNASIVGDLQGSEIKTGADYFSYLAGLDPVRRPSQINPIRLRGSLVDSVISATYRPIDFIYGNLTAPGFVNDEAGPGLIRGNLEQGGAFEGNQLTALYNQGAGFFARFKRGGYLPPPQRPTRIHAVNVDF